MSVGKLLPGGALRARPRPAPRISVLGITTTFPHKPVAVRQQGREYFKGATIPFYLHPREDLQSKLKDNIPRRCVC